MEEFAWLTGPLCDDVAVPAVDLKREGFSPAVMLWDRMRSTLQQDSANSSQLLCNLSLAQWTSYQLLLEWWNGKTQDPALSQAAQATLRNSCGSAFVDEPAVASWYDTGRLRESVYHQRMFSLFLHEFLDEKSRERWEPEKGLSGSTLDVLQWERKHCAELAAVQRVAYSFFAADATGLSQVPETSLLLKRIIGASLESCPWLLARDDLVKQPYFLWAVVNRRTVVVEELENCPPYVCVSHTWGRWRPDTVAKLDGVPWDIPHNSKFVVEELPKNLSIAFRTGFVWFDLLCIPQDESLQADLEIAKQTAIFGNASSVVIWANAVTSWTGLENLFKLISAHYLQISTASQTKSFYNTASVDHLADQEIREEHLFDFKLLERWLTSLWTLQEACLWPDMVLFSRIWEPLTAEKSTIITLDCIVAFGKLLTTSVFEAAVEKALLCIVPSNVQSY